MRRRSLLAGLVATPALAQGWQPSGPVRVVIPFPPGNALDGLGRLLAGPVQAALGQPVVIDNRPGGGTLIATEAMARTPPDGQAVLMVANSFVINPLLHQPSPYEPLRQFQPLALLTEVPHVLVVHPALATTFQDFLDRGRRPGTGLSYASTGTGTSLHLGAEQFRMLAGLNAQHVPYRGTPQIMADLLPGRIDWMFGNLPDVLPLIREGKLRALGLAAAHRSPFMPELPTMGELGFPQSVSNSNYGVVMPAGGRPEVVARQSAAWLAAARDPALKARLEGQGFEVLAQPPDVFAARMRADAVTYAGVIQAANVKPD